jgi:LysR family nitrogen assimilation transcriptional regulator
MRSPSPRESEPDYPRSVITLAQIEMFLALVEEGGVARAAERLGVGRSTISAHAKTIADEIGHHLFHRQQGGQIVTDAGLEAYGRLRALFLQATFAFEHFRSANPRTATFTTARVPFGFPGCAFDRVLERTTRRLAGVCLLPDYSQAPPIDELATDELGFSYLSWDADTGLIADRWVLIRHRTPHCAGGRPTTLAELTGVRLHAPRLPAALRPTLAALAQEANASLDTSQASLPEVLVEIGKSPKAVGIVPASLFNPGLLDATLDVAVLESTHFDPAISVAGLKHPEIARLLREELATALRERLAQPRTRSSRPSLPQTLPLKYCRSFLALYEEANVGRAAERLSIVQPALTVQLHRIEEQAGCSLFARSHQGLSANERADTLYRLLRPLVASVAATLRHLRASADKSAAPIRIGLMPALDDESVMSQGFAIALDRWSRRHADDVLQVMEGYSGTLVRWLQNGAVDFVLVDRMFADFDLLLEPIIEDKMAVVIAAGSDLLSPGPVALTRLAGLPLVLPSTRHGLRTLLVQSLHKAGLTLQPRIEVDSMAGCLNMVKIARYATVLPLGSVEKSCHRRGVSVHEIVNPQIVRTISLVRLRARASRPAEAEFLDELRLAFGAPHPVALATASRDFYGPTRQLT